ncbi:hypothetical protein SISNIDRAFT_496984 [Sistotremastrum niveocremeum HHB9708]|uniref:Fungal-type protein kinase domain-containing protein n=1 Tax=Sistotremastrum niveocremeum HHB9708 TaxID=1314777 RepID=A0A164RD50_9AGAM|nr:hypothetical protein SISNIDRAFT_496984 [Sistotremastrum niveocremeum HHB9708]
MAFDGLDYRPQTPPNRYPTILDHLTRPQLEVKVSEHANLDGTPTYSRAGYFSWKDINPEQLHHWTDFSYSNIMDEFGEILETPMVAESSVFYSAQRASSFVRNEDDVEDRLKRFLWTDVQRALDHVFLPHSTLFPGARTPVPIQEFQAAKTHTYLNNKLGTSVPSIAGLKPDRIAVEDSTDVVRLVGDVKVSWKWASSMADGERREKHKYRQGLSQVNCYSNQRWTRYGFILTEKELQCFRRHVDEDGEPVDGALDLATPIPLSAYGREVMTVELGLWYLCMLAADDDEWELMSSTWDKKSRKRIRRSPIFRG